MSVKRACVHPSAMTDTSAPGPWQGWADLLPLTSQSPGPRAVLPSWTVRHRGLVLVGFI